MSDQLWADAPRVDVLGVRVSAINMAQALDVIRRWIETRARAQFDAGLIDEAGRLRERYDAALPAFSAIGYREAWAVLDGQLTREAAIAEDARRNVAFAKRQRTWFRSEPDIRWLPAGDAATSDAAFVVATGLAAAAR